MTANRINNRLQNIITVLLLLIVIALLAWLTTKYEMSADWTSHGKHSLTDTSIEVLDTLTEPLLIQAYASDDVELRNLIKRFVSRYQKYKADIELDFRNPQLVVEEARNLGIRVNGELVLNYQGRIEHVYTDSEEAFTNALQRLLKGTQRWVYFLEGHGERSPLAGTEYDYAQWSNSLADRGIRTQPFNLLETGAVPDNAAVLVIASPTTVLAEAEMQLIVSYLDRGGNLLWLTEPGEKGLERLQHYLGFATLPGVVIDASTQVLGINSPTITVITRRNYHDHPALSGFNLTTYLPMATALVVADESRWQFRKLFSSGDLSWVETGSLSGEVEFDEATDSKGPVLIGLSLQRERADDTGQQRVIVIGDGDFVSNSYTGSGGNNELGLRLLTWLTGDDTFLSFTGSIRTDTELNISDITLGVMGIGFMLVLPLLMFALGLFIWWRRKRL